MNPPICYGFMILLSYQELVAHKKYLIGDLNQVCLLTDIMSVDGFNSHFKVRSEEI
ncbi:hypothetical protein MX081_01275 [Streptococcus uberis]|uniref:hypothetical protein n=1 Tax=Streptococcus uberis TaxID=1349 RepID=UPI0027DC0394|nr:hypothetical protein [Streptococcus uberis]MCK1252761.1 hypothetical protein [Streptococcus uberis]MCK1258575.1 hypothetical protein [Streptococcus uberis]